MLSLLTHRLLKREKSLRQTLKREIQVIEKARRNKLTFLCISIGTGNTQHLYFKFNNFC
jgi:hypothetical protein